MTRRWWNDWATRVRLVPGSERNLKVTTAEDLRLAELIAKSAGDSKE